MPKKKDMPHFPILRGESVSESGEFSGIAAVVCSPEELEQDWDEDTIVVLEDDLETFFNENPEVLADLFSQVRVVIAEFGESIGQFAATATEHAAMGIVGVRDATHVLENGMHIRVEAKENQADIYFID